MSSGGGGRCLVFGETLVDAKSRRKTPTGKNERNGGDVWTSYRGREAARESFGAKDPLQEAPIEPQARAWGVGYALFLAVATKGG